MPKQTGAGLGTGDSRDHTSKQEAGEERTPTGCVASLSTLDVIALLVQYVVKIVFLPEV